jgi:hypothetical protein
LMARGEHRSLPRAVSRRPGRSKRTTPPASSSETRPVRRSAISISRTSPVGAQRPTCSQRARRGGWPSTLPSCRCCCGSEPKTTRPSERRSRLVSVREQFESYESFMIQEWWPDSRRVTDVDSAESQTLRPQFIKIPE